MQKAEKDMYIQRITDEKIKQDLASCKTVFIEGPKGCGKTSSSSRFCKSDVSISDSRNIELAEIAPSLILEGETPRLIDEWQEVPQLKNAVINEADERKGNGQFILTSSFDPYRKKDLHINVEGSGMIRMRTMSLYESGDSSGKVSLKELCSGNIKPCMTGNVDLRDLAYYPVRGGWPENLKASYQKAHIYSKQYLRSMIEEIYCMDMVKRDKHKMKLLLKALAKNESAAVSKNKLLKDIQSFDKESIDRDTAAEYLNVFSRAFLTDNQPPVSGNINPGIRIKQAEKRHLADPSLACALLNATPEMLINDLETFGFIFEALCERDLKIYAESFGAKLYHYQDYNNKEIDAVIAMPDGSWCGFEIKLGANKIEEAAEELLEIRKAIENDPHGKPPKTLCVICGMSNAAYQRPDGVYVVPITALAP